MKKPESRKKHTASAAEAAENKAMLCENLSFASTEAYKLLRTNITFSFADEGACRIIGVTSALPGEGKSLTAINLGYSLAQMQKRVLLVDADLRIPSVEKKLSLPGSPGLSNLLVGMGKVADTVKTYASDANGTQFDIMVSGDIPPNPSELLGSERMKTLVQQLTQYYDYIIFDLPPVSLVSDALVVSRLTQGMLVVVRQDHAQRAALADCVKQLEFVEARILGFVLNCVGTGSGRRYGRYYGRYYGKYYKKYGGYYSKYGGYYGGYYGKYGKTPKQSGTTSAT